MTLPCRSCGGRVERFLDLGEMPLSDRLRTPDMLQEHEPRHPLEVAVCTDCSLVQILEEVDPSVLFCADYPYFSSFSDHLLRHSKSNVDRIMHDRDFDESHLVVEIACNDGYLLQYFQEYGVPVIGIDPAAGPVAETRRKGIPAIQGFFGRDVAEGLRDAGKRADCIVANNVLAHVPDLNGFVAGIAALLKDDGTTSIEAPYVRDLIEHCEFDTIYHEHLCYFSVTAVKALFARHGLHLNRVTHLEIHGGSIRYEASPTSAPDGSVERHLAEEAELGIDRLEFYEGFGARVRALRRELVTTLDRLRADGKTVAAYGAAAKGAILLNYCGLDESRIDFVVDRNVHKHGRYMPGVDIEVLPVETLLERQPDYTLLLPWNFRAEILEQQHEYRQRGGQFIVPVPRVEIVENANVHSH